MKRHRLIIAPLVYEQIRDQTLHIATDSVDRALAWQDRLQRAINGLANFSGYAVDDAASDRLGYTLHKYVFESTYLIHFTIDKPANSIRIVNFRHGARLPRLGEP